jgi:hypothetical protein
MCGGCGGSRRVQNARKQVIGQAVKASAPAKKTTMFKQISRNPAPTNKIEVKRQYVMPRQTCPKCGYPTMTVNIAKRERSQCSNSNCRYIVK